MLYIRLSHLDISINFQCQFYVSVTLGEQKYQSRLVDINNKRVSFDETIQFTQQKGTIQLSIFIQSDGKIKICGTTQMESTQLGQHRLNLTKCPDKRATFTLQLNQEDDFQDLNLLTTTQSDIRSSVVIDLDETQSKMMASTKFVNEDIIKREYEERLKEKVKQMESEVWMKVEQLQNKYNEQVVNKDAQLKELRDDNVVLSQKVKQLYVLNRQAIDKLKVYEGGAAINQSEQEANLKLIIKELNQQVQSYERQIVELSHNLQISEERLNQQNESKLLEQLTLQIEELTQKLDEKKQKNKALKEQIRCSTDNKQLHEHISQLQHQLRQAKQKQQFQSFMNSTFRSATHRTNTTQFFDLPLAGASQFYDANELEQINQDFHSIKDVSLDENFLEEINKQKQDQEIQCEMDLEIIRVLELKCRSLEQSQMELKVQNVSTSQFKQQTIEMDFTESKHQNEQYRKTIELLTNQNQSLRQMQESLQSQLLQRSQKLGDLMNLAFDRGTKFTELIETLRQ